MQAIPMRRLMAGLVVNMIGQLPVAAELPALENGRWIDCCFAYENKRCEFQLSPLGKGWLIMLDDKGKALARGFKVPIEFGIEEKTADGTPLFHPLSAATLVADPPAKNPLTDYKFHGKTEGDASFEVQVNEAHGMISLNGKILDHGSLTQPLRFAIRLQIPNGYPHDKFRAFDGLHAKAFAEKTKDDKLQLRSVDGRTRRQSLTAPVSAAAKEISGIGVAQMSLEYSTLKGRKLEFGASKGTALTFQNPLVRPLHDGFSVTWAGEWGTDKEDKRRFTLMVK
jgi:hypothetical protein